MQELDKAMEIFDKLSFFGGQRAGRELWNDKPREVQDEDIASFNRDIEWLRDFIHKHMNDGWISVEKELPPNRKGAITMTENKAVRELEKMKNDLVVLGYLKDTEREIEILRMAITALKEIQQYRKIGTLEELKTSEKEEDILKFYYCESEDDYYIGKRKENFYYARYGETGFEWFRSRYLPWGKHVIEPHTLWKEYIYPSEPKEISFFEWLSGFLKKYCGGTVEECREAVEKQKPMKVNEVHVDEYYCPACGSENCCDQGKVCDKYCPVCGHAIYQEERDEEL